MSLVLREGLRSAAAVCFELLVNAAVCLFNTLLLLRRSRDQSAQSHVCGDGRGRPDVRHGL